MRLVLRVIAGLLSAVAIVAAVWIVRLPNKAECIASGRIVDPTERHCEAAGGYQQLQEHATFHVIPIVLGATIVLAVGYVVLRIVRRKQATPTA